MCFSAPPSKWKKVLEKIVNIADGQYCIVFMDFVASVKEAHTVLIDCLRHMWETILSMTFLSLSPLWKPLLENRSFNRKEKVLSFIFLEILENIAGMTKISP